MTRVNIIDPADLTDQHLVAERLELTFVLVSASRSLASKKGLQIGDSFVLGNGHIKFFHDKLLYIQKRFDQITVEMIARGMKPLMEYPDVSFPDYMMKDWAPSKKDYVIILERIIDRIKMKPEWYRYRGKPIPEQFTTRYLPYLA